MKNPPPAPTLLSVRARMLLASIFLLLSCVMQAFGAATPVTSNGVVNTLNAGGSASVNDVVTDASGNVYISDTSGSQIIRITPEGSASPLPITGLTPALQSPSALAISPVAGALYILDSGNNRVVRVDPGTGAASVLATPGFTLSAARGIAVDASDNVFISDANRILKLTSYGSASVLVTTSGTSLSGLSQPMGLAVDTYGSLYIADYNNNRVVKVTAGGVGSVVNTVSLTWPIEVAVSNDGTLYISDSQLYTANHVHGIVRLDPTGSVTILTAGNTAMGIASGIAVSPMGKVYVADNGNNRVLSIEVKSVDFGHVQLGSSTAPVISLPFTIDAATTLTSVSAITNGIHNLDFTIAANSGTPCTTGSNGIACTVNVLFTPTAPGLRRGALVLNYAGGSLTVPLYGIADAPVAALSPVVASVINTGSATLASPFQTVLDPAGNIYVANYGGTTITKIPAGGGQGVTVNIPALPGVPGIAQPTGLAMDGAGNLFISDYGHHRIVELTLAGVSSVLTVNGSIGSLHSPTTLAFDGAGNLWINDYGNRRIVKVSPSPNGDGTVANGNGAVISLGSYTPSGANTAGLTIDVLGNLYFPDPTNNRILKITPAGVVEPLDLSAAGALSGPLGAFADGFGNLYIVDSGNCRIVRRTASGDVSALPFSGPIFGPYAFGINADPAGNLIISDFSGAQLLSLNVGQTALAFPSTKAGETSAAQTVTVTNLGNQALQFASDPVYPTHFSAGGSGTHPVASGTVLAPGTSGEVSIAFTPQTPGSKSGTITLTNNTQNVSNNTQLITVAGTALDPTRATSVTLTPSPATVKLGESLSLTALVTDTTAQSIPTGEVSFTDQVGSTTSSLNGSPVTLDNAGRATLSGVTLSGVGTHTITANYGGADLAFSASSVTAQVTVNKAEVSITGPASQPVQVTVGQAGSVPVTVGGVNRVGAPTGSLDYDLVNASNVSVASASLPLTAGSADSTATVPLPSTLEAGHYTLVMSYGGDGSYAASASPVSIAIRVDQITPVIAWAPPAAITYGTNLSNLLNASVTSGNSAVAGTVVYTATPSGGSAGTVTSSTVLGAGNYMLTATFTPADTAKYVTATKTVPLVVNKASLTVTADPKSITYGEVPQYTATLTGFVESETASTAVTGAAVFSVNPANPSAAGTYTITPALGTLASSNYSFVSFVPATLTIGKATPVLTLTSSASPSLLTTAVTFTATAPLQATGTVTFYDGATALGTVTLSHGVAAYTTSSLAVGTHSITASYAGDNNYAAATRAAVSQVVGKATGMIALVSSANPSLLTTGITFTATAPPQATGTVTFYDGATALGSVALSQGVATYVTSSLSAATHSITAVYAGDSNYAAATSSAVSQVVIDYTVTGGVPGQTGGTGGSLVPTQVVSPGGTALFELTLSPIGSTASIPLSAPMTFTVSDNLPAGSVVALTAPGVPAGARTLTLPAGASAGSVQLRVQLPQQTATLHRGDSLTTLPFAFGILMLPFTGKMGRAAGKRARRSGLWLVLALASLATVAGLSGCGAVNSGFVTAQHYTITVTATSGSLSRSTSFNLTVR